jgi:chromosome segregation ATPase
LLCVLALLACGKGHATDNPKDLGSCITIERDGREYYLCEKLSSSSKPEAPRTNDLEKASEEAEAAKREAEHAAARAVEDAKEAQQTIEQLQHDASLLSKRVDDAVSLLASAQTQADRDTAKAKLDQLRVEKLSLDQRIAEARAKAVRAQRLKGVKISRECLDNPLASGCN